MPKKDKRRKKINIKKERQKLIKEKRKELEKQDIYQEKRNLKKIDIRLNKETNLYWIRALSGLITGLVGPVIGLVGWWLLLWMVCFWLLLPFLMNFLIFKYSYDKEEWNWKNIIKPGLGIFFLLFMIASIIVHTLIAFI
ncbi:MAG: hypothetical protein EU532_12530 [Promethearchaeota archaeon]|nr:MAG: hypothetical protein EU532_12530 [Candidatus Lokiarchaeota archaeon]